MHTVEILGVAKFGNLFATCEISQVANFCNLRTLLTCASPVPVDCFLTHLFGGFIQVSPHVNLVLLNIIVISLF